jgi:hypothetical protein
MLKLFSSSCSYFELTANLFFSCVNIVMCVESKDFSHDVFIDEKIVLLKCDLGRFELIRTRNSQQQTNFLLQFCSMEIKRNIFIIIAIAVLNWTRAKWEKKNEIIRQELNGVRKKYEFQ